MSLRARLLLGDLDVGQFRRRWNEHLVADDLVVRPVRWGHQVGRVEQLEALDDPNDLVHVASEFLRVLENRTNDPAGVDDDHRPCRHGSSLIWAEHAELQRD